MNAVGIDVPKGKSVIAAMCPLSEAVASSFILSHTAVELKRLADCPKSSNGETKTIMEYPGKYYKPISEYLYNAGFLVSVVDTYRANVSSLYFIT